MLRDVHPQDVSVEPFKTFKRFTFTNSDSGSGIYALNAQSGSLFNFMTGSAASRSLGQFNEDSKSLDKPKSTWYSTGTFYDKPVYYTLNNIYYERFSNRPKMKHSSNKVEPFLSYGPSNPNINFRELHGDASLISVPQQFFGEGIKPNSVKVIDDAGSISLDIRDDGDGNLYDYAFSSSYAAYKSGSFQATPANSSSAVIGNVFYNTGTIVMTSTGSKYLGAFLGTGTDGFSLDYRSTHTIYQHEYIVTSRAGQHNSTMNVSATFERSGSTTIREGATPFHLFPPGDNPSGGKNSTGSFASFYNATQFYEPFVSHSEFSPYITTIGLYNDAGELLVVGRTSKPIKNDPELAMSFVVRFDV